MRVTLADEDENTVVHAVSLLGSVLNLVYDGTSSPVTERRDGWFRVTVTAQLPDE